jgi:hypothetical protein
VSALNARLRKWKFVLQSVHELPPVAAAAPSTPHVKLCSFLCTAMKPT